MRLTSSQTILKINTLKQSKLLQSITTGVGGSQAQFRIKSEPVSAYKKGNGMRTKLNKYRFNILTVFLIIGMSIAGWAITFRYNHTAKSAESQKAPNNDSLLQNIVPAAINHRNTILMLVCTGLIGFIGVNRQGKKLDSLAKTEQPERKDPENFLDGNVPERQHPHG